MYVVPSVIPGLDPKVLGPNEYHGPEDAENGVLLSADGTELIKVLNSWTGWITNKRQRPTTGDNTPALLQIPRADINEDAQDLVLLFGLDDTRGTVEDDYASVRGDHESLATGDFSEDTIIENEIVVRF